MSVKTYETNTRKAAHFLGLLLAKAAGDNAEDNAVVILAGTGAPSGGTYGEQTLAASQKAVAIRQDATSTDAFMFFTLNGGTAWTAVDAGAVDLDLLTAAVVDPAADSFAFIDADDSDASKKDAIADLIAAIAGGGLSASAGVLSLVDMVVPMSVFGPWAIDGDGAETNGAGMVGTEPTLTAAADAFAVIEDDGVFAALADSAGEAGYTGAYQLFPDAPVAETDYVYFGDTVPFCEFALDMSATPATYDATDVVEWFYWDGAAWSALTIAYDGSEATIQDGSEFGERDGALSFVPPADWASTTVNGQAGFFIRAGIAAGKAANMTQVGLLNATNHQIVSPTVPFVADYDGTLIAIRASGGEATLGTTADTKFIVMNYTTGLHSGELTWTKGTRAAQFTGLSLGITRLDPLGVLVTQEDGTAEHDTVQLELTITPA